MTFILKSKTTTIISYLGKFSKNYICGTSFPNNRNALQRLCCYQVKCVVFK